MKRVKQVFGSTCFLLFAVALTSVAALGQMVVVDPYADIEWAAFEQHKANLHTHTTQSDGSATPSQVIDEYWSRGYTILALTDHNLCTWPWTELATMERKGRALQSDNAARKEPNVPSEERKRPRVYAYENREPEALGMLAIAGNEYSIHHHANGFFVEHETRSRKLEKTIEEVGELGGLIMINHPGRYWELAEDGTIPEDVVARYATWCGDNPHVLGLEVINSGKRYPHDVKLWDAVLSNLMPEHTVWGFSNDDMHSVARLGRDWDVFVIESLDEAQVRGAMEKGQFYFCTVSTHPEEARSVAETPAITAIEHDAEAGTVTIAATSGGVPLPEEQCKWISQGNVIYTGATLNYRDTEGVDKYFRAELTGQGGTTYTNPWGVKK